MITITNYTKETASFDFSKSKVLQDGDKFFRDFSDLYNDDDDIKKAIDNHLKLVNMELSRSRFSEKPRLDEKKKAGTQTKSVASKRKVEVEISEKPRLKTKTAKQQGEPVNALSAEVKFIKRYALLHGKTKTVEQLLSFLHTLQKAIMEKVISKSSKFAEEITAIQSGLIKAINAGGGKIELDEDNLEKYKAIAGGQSVIHSIPFLKRFIALTGKQGVKDKAASLLFSIKSAKQRNLFDDDPYKSKMELAIKAISSYVEDKEDRIVIPAYELQGLYGLLGIDMPQPTFQEGRVISSVDLMGATFVTMQFDGKWKELIGNPSDPFKAMFFGGPGNGKTTGAILFAHYLASKHKKKVLIITKEEGFVYTFKEKMDRLKAYHPNLFIVDSIPLSLAPYDVIVMDSVNTLRLSPEDLKDLYQKNPKKSFLCLHQVTKDGKFRGSQEYEHDVDVSVYFQNMVATAQKNRFGAKNPVNVL